MNNHRYKTSMNKTLSSNAYCKRDKNMDSGYYSEKS